MAAFPAITDLQPTVRCPFVTDSMLRMLRAFKSGGYDALADEMYKINAEHLAMAKTAMGENASLRTYARAGLEALENDRQEKRHLVTLLHTIDAMHIESLIKGTFAYDHFNVPGFSDKLYELDNSSGVYIVTFSVNGRSGLGLHSRELEKVRDRISRYYAGHNVKVPNDTHPTYTDKLDDAMLAARLETGYQSSCAGSDSTRTYDNTLGLTKKGERGLAFEGWDTLLETLQQRTLQEPNGNTRQHQCLAQIGCSTELAASVTSDDPLQGLSKRTAEPCSLVLRCLKDMDVEVVSLRVPLVKVWEMGQLAIAEIGMTLLCSSLLNDGGLNGIGAGARKGIEEPDKWRSARREICLLRDTFSANLAKSDEILKSNSAIVEEAIRLQVKGNRKSRVEQNMTTSKGAADLRDRIKNSTETVAGVINDVINASKEADQRVSQAENLVANYRSYLGFYSMVNDWIGKSDSRRGVE